jgi:ribosome-associated protein
VVYVFSERLSAKESKPILTTTHYGLLEPADLKDLIIASLDDDKAMDIETIDLNGQSSLADYMVIASGTSSRQVARMADKLSERLHARGMKDLRIEGASQGDWVVLDAGDVIVHLFRPEVREFYNIEKMWKMNETGTPSGHGLRLA